MCVSRAVILRKHGKWSMTARLHFILEEQPPVSVRSCNGVFDEASKDEHPHLHTDYPNQIQESRSEAQ